MSKIFMLLPYRSGNLNRNVHDEYCFDHSTAFTIASITFFASPNTIIVFGW